MSAASGAPWVDMDLPDAFAGALLQRRREQATQIIQRFPELRDGTVLDYGSGQGAFVAAMVSVGLDAWGCDIDLGAPRQLQVQDRLFQLVEAWEVPGGSWHTIALLDVIEHHADPGRFLATLTNGQVLVKVPLSTGPLARGAWAAARFGHPRLLEALFLVGDVSPHQVLFSARGLDAVARRSGWSLIRAARLADVGRELPDRLRVDGLAALWLRWPLVLLGAAVGALAQVWSDTTVRLFERSD